MRSSVSAVASTAPWPARAWSEWPCVISARSTARGGSMWKPPGGQHSPAGVETRSSWGRMPSLCIEAAPQSQFPPMNAPTLFLSSGDLLADRRYERARGLEADGDLDAAADLLAQALDRAPGFVSAWFALGEVRAYAGDRAGAVAAFRSALAADPADRHGAALRLARLGALAPTAAMSGAYVRTLFDQYAPHFDQTLVEVLGYRGPALLRAAIETARASRTGPLWFARMIDLGCGTGLAAAAFRGCCETICGVDLSPAMVEAARRKGLYERLDVDDMLAFLEQEGEGACDLVLAADAFVYLGDLAPICRAAARALAPAGLFGFTVETAGAGVVLGEKLRYAHGADHVRAALARAGLDLLALDPASTRTESGAAVPGLVVVAERPQARRMGFADGSTHPTNTRQMQRSHPMTTDVTEAPAVLPEPFARWFAARGWTPREHQLELLAKARAGRSVLLVAPTGGGKTLAGFLPTLVELNERPNNARSGLHTLYISPLKALAVDIARNLEQPVNEMGLAVRIETRTGDTPISKRQRQRRDPPDILLTTPEQVALLIASADAPLLFRTLRRVVLDELHALVTSKRGDLLALGLARLYRLAPRLATVGLSATVAQPDDLCRFLVAQPRGGDARADLILAAGGAAPHVTMLDTHEHLPWSGHSARHALAEIYDLIRRHKTTLVFVNTRSQAEMLFQQFWRINEDSLAIALHHGSLDVAQRRKVEDAMAKGRLRAVVCTSSLDLGIDWGDVDLVVNVGAPKGSSRLLQRIGRANHRLDQPSRGVLVPANRFEVLECSVAIDAIAENAQDTPPARTGALDVLAQHVLGSACAAPFDADELYAEAIGAAPYAGLARAEFDAVVDFVATGGYALKSYERFAKIRRDRNGRWRISHPRIAQQYRLNVGTIVEEAMLKVRLVRAREGRHGHSGPIARGGRILGEIEEYFVEGLVPGDTFVFSGEIG